ncbi:MAG: hypothetical protein LBD27_07900 [Tannerella sp.]|nr:hypothetical protein [Tannerella sp.]
MHSKRLHTGVRCDYTPASDATTHQRPMRLHTGVRCDYTPASGATTHRRQIEAWEKWK